MKVGSGIGGKSEHFSKMLQVRSFVGGEGDFTVSSPIYRLGKYISKFFIDSSLAFFVCWGMDNAFPNFLSCRAPNKK